MVIAESDSSLVSVPGTLMMCALRRPGVGPEDYAQVAAEFYRRNYWAESPVKVEVWLEKDALAGVLVPTVVEECGLNLHVTRGYASVSYLQSAADFIRQDDRPTYVYLLRGLANRRVANVAIDDEEVA